MHRQLHYLQISIAHVNNQCCSWKTEAAQYTGHIGSLICRLQRSSSYVEDELLCASSEESTSEYESSSDESEDTTELTEPGTPQKRGAESRCCFLLELCIAAACGC